VHCVCGCHTFCTTLHYVTLNKHKPAAWERSVATWILGKPCHRAQRAFSVVERCAAGPKVEHARHEHGQDRRPQEAARGRGVVEAGAALKDALPQQDQLARRIIMKEISSHCVYVLYCTCIDSYTHTLGSLRMNFLYNVSVHRKE
jgi:hypothetical protein